MSCPITKIRTGIFYQHPIINKAPSPCFAISIAILRITSSTFLIFSSGFLASLFFTLVSFLLLFIFLTGFFVLIIFIYDIFFQIIFLYFSDFFRTKNFLYLLFSNIILKNTKMSCFYLL